MDTPELRTPPQIRTLVQVLISYNYLLREMRTSP